MQRLRRLTKKADWYDEHGFLNNEDTREKLKNSLMDSAKYFANSFQIQESSIVVDIHGTETSVEFGNLDVDGFKFFVSVYGEGEINRIIVSGFNKKYKETRDQSLLEQFLNKDNAFYDWAEQALEEIDG